MEDRDLTNPEHLQPEVAHFYTSHHGGIDEFIFGPTYKKKFLRDSDINTSLFQR